ncbi:MAG: FtsX-like permease family protein [Phycisphaerales bacterium]|nr:FtsX-like permease family protein [Phycisphaerales bacterium]
MWRIALRMLFGNRGKYLSLVFGLTFAVLLITQQGAIFLGLLTRATGPLQNVVQPDLWVTDPETKYIGDVRGLGDDDLNRVRSVAGVAWAEPFFASRALVELGKPGDRGSTFKTAQLLGVSRSTMVGRPPEMTRGRIEDLRIADAVIVDESSRSKLGNVEIGDTLKLNDKRALVVGFGRAKLGFESNALIYTTYDNALRFVPVSRKAMTFVLVEVKPGFDVKEISVAIGALPNLAAFTTKEMRLRTIGFILRETGIGINFGITVLLGFVVGLVVSAAIFYQFTLDNLRSYGVLKAMGARTPTLVAMILAQSLVVGLTAYGLGVGLASLFGLLNNATPNSELAFVFPWQLMVASLFAVLACVSLGSLLSLGKVIRLEPAIVFK